MDWRVFPFLFGHCEYDFFNSRIQAAEAPGRRAGGLETAVGGTFRRTGVSRLKSNGQLRQPADGTEPTTC